MLHVLVPRICCPMMGPSHQFAGVASWLAVAPFLHVTTAQIAVGALIAEQCAHSYLSPDIDRYVCGGPELTYMHRRWPHFWAVIGAAWLAVILCVPSRWQWAAFAVVVAWTSHLLGDFIFGKLPVWRRRGRWIRAGIGLRVGKKLEKKVAYPTLAVVAGALVFNLARVVG